MIFCIFQTWVSASFLGVLKIWLFYQAISENYFAGHYLLILKPSLAFCLSNQSTVLNKTIEGSKLNIDLIIEQYISLFLFLSRSGDNLKSAYTFLTAFLHKFLICLLNINFQSTAISTIISSSLNRIHSRLLEHLYYCWDTSTLRQVSNCDCLVLENYLDHKFQWPQDGLNCEYLA